MKIILAPDSYKNCLRANEVAEALKRGILSAKSDCEVVCLPLSDGGEGLVTAFLIGKPDSVATTIDTTDIFGGAVKAQVAILPNQTAVVESASAVGIELIPAEKLNPMVASSAGLGKLLLNLLKSRIRDFIIGLGGTATIDGGIGMLQELGWKFFTVDGELISNNAGGKDLNRVAKFDDSDVPPMVKQAHFIIASDVTTPLARCAAIYGPQKGATPEQVKILTRGLLNFASCWGENGNRVGDGAAGGLGFAFRHVLGGEYRSGANLLMDELEFDRMVSCADLLITGEGCSDRQTAEGKLCGMVAMRAAKHQVPTLLISGALSDDFSDDNQVFFQARRLTPKGTPLNRAIAEASTNLENFGKNLPPLIEQEIWKK